MAEGSKEETVSGYSNVHRAVLRALLSRQVVTEEELLRLVERAYSYYSPGAGTVRMNKALKIVDAINEKVHQHGFLIVKRLDEREGTHKFVFISESLTQEQHEFEEMFREEEFKLLHEVVDAIMQRSDRKMDISSLRRTERKSPLSITGYIIEQWFQREWINYCDDRSFVTLGVRALAELQTYLVNQYGLSVCACCDFIVFTSVYKSCKVCQKVFHEHCFRSYVDSIDKLSGSTCPFKDCTARLSDIQ